VTFVLSFVSMIVLRMEGKETCVEDGDLRGRAGEHAWKKGHAWKRIDLCRDRWKDGKRNLEGFNVLYILLSLPSVT